MKQQLCNCWCCCKLLLFLVQLLNNSSTRGGRLYETHGARVSGPVSFLGIFLLCSFFCIILFNIESHLSQTWHPTWPQIPWRTWPQTYFSWVSGNLICWTSLYCVCYILKLPPAPKGTRNPVNAEPWTTKWTLLQKMTSTWCPKKGFYSGRFDLGASGDTFGALVCSSLKKEPQSAPKVSPTCQSTSESEVKKGTEVSKHASKSETKSYSTSDSKNGLKKWTVWLQSLFAVPEWI